MFLQSIWHHIGLLVLLLGQLILIGYLLIEPIPQGKG